MCRVGEHQQQLAHRCSPFENFAHMKWDMEMGHLWLKWVEHLSLNVWGILWLNGSGIYDLMGGTFIT